MFTPAVKERTVHSGTTSKGTKKFRYQSFSERIGALNIDVLHKVDEYQFDLDTDSNFAHHLENWRELNTTAQFADFYHRVQPLCTSLPLLLHSKHKVVEALLDELQPTERNGGREPDPAALPPALNLITMLARDLRHEFYEFFPQFMTSLLQLMDPQNPTLLELLFSSLLFLFKYLVKDLVKDIPMLFDDHYSHLLAHRKEYVRRVAAESLAFLLRKLSTSALQVQLLRMVTHTPKSIGSSSGSSAGDDDDDGDEPMSERAQTALREQLDDGLGHLLFQVVRGVRHRLHSKASTMLPFYLDECLQYAHVSVQNAFKHLVSHVDTDNAAHVWSVFLKSVAQQLDTDPTAAHLPHLLTIIRRWTHFHHGDRVHDPTTLDIILQSLVLSKQPLQAHPQAILDLFASCVLVLGSRPFEASMSAYLKAIFKLRDASDAVFAMAARLGERIELMTDAYVAQLLKYVQTVLTHAHDDAQQHMHVLSFLSQWPYAKARVSDEVLAAVLAPLEEASESPLHVLHLALGALQNLHLGSKTLNKVAQTHLYPLLDRMPNDSLESACVRAQLVRVLLQGMSGEQLVQEAMACADSPHMLTVLADECVQRNLELEDEELRDEFTARVFEPNMMSRNHTLRLHTLRIWACFTHPAWAKDMAQLMAEIEEIDPLNPNEIREKTTRMRTLDTYMRPSTMDQSYREHYQRFLQGTLYAKLSLVLPEVALSLRDLATLDFDSFWRVFSPVLTEALYNASHESPDDVEAALLQEALQEAEGDEVHEAFVRHVHDVPPHLNAHDYAEAMLTILAEMGNAVYPASTELARLFLFALMPEYASVYRDEHLGADTSVFEAHPELEEEYEAAMASDIRPAPSRKQLLNKLRLFLRIFSNLTKPRRIEQPVRDALYHVCMRFLMKTEESIQQLALEVILRWQNESHMAHKDHLRNLVQPKKMAETLVLFSLDVDAGVANVQERPHLLPLVFRILFARLVSRRGKRNRRAIATSRNKIFTYFSNFQPEELRYFVDLMLQPFRECLARVEETGQPPLRADTRKLLGVLHFIEDVVRQLGSRLKAYLGDFLDVIVAATRMSLIIDEHEASKEAAMEVDDEEEEEEDKQDDDEEEEEEEDGGQGDGDDDDNEPAGDVAASLRLPATGRQAKQIRSLCLKRTAQIMRKFPRWDFDEAATELLTMQAERIRAMPLHNVYNMTGLLDFLLTLSNHRALVHLLAVQEDAVPSVLRMISVPHINPSVLSSVLSFVENLLGAHDDHEGVYHRYDASSSSSMQVDGDDKGGDDQEAKVDVLEPHVQVLLEQMQQLVELHAIDRKVDTEHLASEGKNTATALGKTHGKTQMAQQIAKEKKHLRAQSGRELIILSQVAKYVNDGDRAQTLLDLLTPHLRDKRTHKAHVVSILEIVGQLVPLLHDPMTYWRTVSALYATLGPHSAARKALGTAMHAFSLANKALKPVADALSLLNAFSKRRLDEYDFDARAQGFQRVMDLMPSAEAEHLWPIIACYQALLQDEDMSMRNMTASAFLELIGYVGAHPQQLPGVLTGPVYSCIKEGLRSHNASHRKDFVRLLAETVRQEGGEAFPDYQWLLGHGDEEQDFLMNIVHIQLHRRTRAMLRLRRRMEEALEEGEHPLGAGTLVNVVIPLVNHAVHEAGDADNDLFEEGTRTLGALAKHLSWGHYYRFLRTNINLIESKPEMEKRLIRIVTKWLDAFHFEAADEESSGHRALVGFVLPALDKLLVEVKSTERRGKDSTKVISRHSIRVPVALAVVKVLHLLPEAVMKKNLPRLVMKMALLLRSREQTTRDSTRNTLVRVLQETGVSYLRFMLEELKGTLTRGYQVHVLAYTLFSILEAMVPRAQCGDLDYCLDIMLEIMLRDMVGLVAAEKKEDKVYAGMRETKATRSLDSFQLLASVVDFKSSVVALVEPVQRLMYDTTSREMARTLQEMLRHLGIGILANKSANVDDVLLFVFALLQDNRPLCVPPPKKDRGKRRGDGASTPRETSHMTEKLLVDEKAAEREAAAKAMRNSHFKANAHLLVEFALNLLHTLAKRGRVHRGKKEHAQLLDPFVEEVLAGMKLKYAECRVQALKAVGALVQFDLPSMHSHMPAVLKQVLRLIESAGSMESDLAQASLKCLTVLLRDCPYAELSDAQLRALVHMLSLELEPSKALASVLTLVRALVGRRFVCPEMYDLATLVGKLMVTSMLEQVRGLSSTIFLNFLLDYPLGTKRLTQHMEFLMKNLAYKRPSGRLAVLSLLASMCTQFPEAVLDERAPMMFLPLVMRVAVDEDARCRQEAGGVLRKLLAHVGDKTFRQLMSMAVQWMSSGMDGMQEDEEDASSSAGSRETRKEAQLRRLGAQVLSISLEVREGMVRAEMMDTVLPLLTNMLDMRDWQPVYHALKVLEKLCASERALLFDSRLDTLWSSLPALLVHPNQWIRAVACRVLGLLFAALPASLVDTHESPLEPEDLWLYKENKLYEVAWCLCAQLLDKAQPDEATGDQLVRNLLYVCRLATHHVQLAVDPEHATKHDDDEDDEDAAADSLILRQDQVLHLGVPGATGGRNEHRNSDSDSDVDEEEQEQEQEDSDAPAIVIPEVNPLLRFVFHRLSKSSAQLNAQGQVLVFKLFAGACMQLGEQVRPYLLLIMQPLYKATERGEDERFATASEMAQQVLDLLRDSMGTRLYVHVYNRVHSKVRERREDRKRRLAVKKIVDPEGDQKRRRVKAERKKASRKRKVQQWKAVKEGVAQASSSSSSSSSGGGRRRR